MTRDRSMQRLLVVLGVCTAFGACGRPAGGPTGDARTVIQNKGSDTMVNLAQAWAEEYHKVNPNVAVEVSGGGSGVGIAALMKGAVDLANSSRNMKPQEIEDAKRNTGKAPKEHIVGYDALAVYVHKDSPINEISVDELAQVFAEGGTATRWSQLGVKLPGARDDTIVRVSRQSNSGTYEFFREHVLGNKDFKPGSRDLNGSKEVVELVGGTPTAIGYSGMGYATPAVKMLRLAPKKGAPAVPPNLENAISGAYPLARALYMYTLGEPQGAARGYIDWILTDDGQKIVEQTGYVPVPKDRRAAPASAPASPR